MKRCYYMTKLDDETRLHHMLDCSRKVEAFMRGKTRTDLEADEMLALAVVRLIEVVGEAANNVSAAKQAELSRIPWRQMVGMRNRLIHAYFEINYGVIWDTATINIPALVAQLEVALEDETDDTH